MTGRLKRLRLLRCACLLQDTVYGAQDAFRLVVWLMPNIHMGCVRFRHQACRIAIFAMCMVIPAGLTGRQWRSRKASHSCHCKVRMRKSHSGFFVSVAPYPLHSGIECSSGRTNGKATKTMKNAKPTCNFPKLAYGMCSYRTKFQPQAKET